MVTRNTIAKFFKNFANSHYQLKDFGYGDFWEISQSKGARYPLMWVSPQPATIQGNEVLHTYAIAIADRVRSSEDHELEVESDTFQICQDLLAALNDQSLNEWELDENITLQPFTEWSKDDDAGFIMNLTFKVDNQYDACAIPWDGITPPEEGGCADAILMVNGVMFTNISSGATYNLQVRNQDGDYSGAKDGSIWRVQTAVTCSDAVANLRNSLGTLLLSTNISSGGSQDITAPDATAVLKDTDGLTLLTETIPSGVSENIVAPDSVAVLKDSGGGTLSTTAIKSNETKNISAPDAIAALKDSAGGAILSENIPSGSTENITAPDAVAVLKDTAGATLSSTNIKSNASVNIVAPNASAVLKDSAGTTISTTGLKSNEAKDITAPDASLLVNGSAFGNIKSNGSFDLPVKDTNGSSVGSKIGSEWIVPASVAQSGVAFHRPKLSQVTSYRTGDEGWRIQNGWYDYVPPAFPKAVAELDFTSSHPHFILKNNLVVNGVSSKIRFVDVNGVQVWGASSNVETVLIDKLTGYMFTRLNPVSGNWNSVIDDALTYSVVVNGVTYDDWYVISQNEAITLFNGRCTSGRMTDSSTSIIIWNGGNDNNFTATTTGFSTTDAMRYVCNLNLLDYMGKSSSSQRTILIRKCENLITAP